MSSLVKVDRCFLSGPESCLSITFLCLEFGLRNLLLSNGFAFMCDFSFLFCSFQNSVFVLYVECFDYHVSGSVSFLIPVVWYSVSLLHLGDCLFLEVHEIFSYYSIDTLSIPLVCISSPSISMIHRFALFMVSQLSCMFHSYVFSIFS
jgi:hypothetical protein